MAELRFDLSYGNNAFVTKPPPKNSQGITVDITWTSQFPNAVIGGTDFNWTGQNAKELNAYKLTGLSNGLGITEAVGLRIYVKCGSSWQLFFDGYINIADPKTKWECDSVTAPSVEIGRVDWFINQIKAFDFNYLKSIGIIQTSDYKKTPYCVTKISQAPLQEAMVALTELAVLKQGFESTRDISKDISKTIADGVSEATLLPPAGFTPVVVADIFQVGFDVFYIIACGTTLLAEGKKIIDSVWSFRKYKLSMREEDIWKRICQKLNLQFSSTIYSGIHKNATWMPKKSVIPSAGNPLSFIRPYNESASNNNCYGHPDENASDWVEYICNKYNGAVNIMLNPNTGNRTLYFEEKHYWNNIGVFTVPNTDPPGYTHNLPAPYNTNLLLLPWNYLVQFATDSTDETTLYRYKGTTCSKIISQNISVNVQRKVNGVGTIVSLPFAHAKRKDYLSNVENLLNTVINFIIQVIQDIINLVTAIYNAIAGVINLFGGNVQPLTPFLLPTNLLNNRLGWMEVSDDKFSLPKNFIGINSNGDWLINQFDEINNSAQMLMNQFHQKNLPTHGAQEELYVDKKFHFCCADYNAIRNKNVITSPDGRLGKFTKMKWDLHNDQATADYGIYTQITNNLHETTTVDGN